MLKFRYPIIILLVGIILVGGGVIYLKDGFNFEGTKVEVIQEGTATDSGRILTVEIAGSVVKPGVYKLPEPSRIDDLLIAAGGFSETANREWSDKYLNRAAKIIDGQKIFIPEQSDVLSAKENDIYQTGSSINQSDSNGLTNVNTASLNQLDKLPGIGPVYGQSIIDHRPYSDVSELLSKGALKKSVYEKVKDLVSVY